VLQGDSFRVFFHGDINLAVLYPLFLLLANQGKLLHKSFGLRYNIRNFKQPAEFFKTMEP